VKKLTLQAEELLVESFETGSADERLGTIQGHEEPDPYDKLRPLLTKPTQCPCTPAF
jgi:hypothetical protein